MNIFKVIATYPPPPPPRYSPGSSYDSNQLVTWKKIFCIKPRRCKNSNKLIWLSFGFRKVVRNSTYKLYRVHTESWYCPKEALFEQLKG